MLVFTKVTYTILVLYCRIIRKYTENVLKIFYSILNLLILYSANLSRRRHLPFQYFDQNYPPYDRIQNSWLCNKIFQWSKIKLSSYVDSPFIVHLKVNVRSRGARLCRELKCYKADRCIFVLQLYYCIVYIKKVVVVNKKKLRSCFLF